MPANVGSSGGAHIHFNDIVIEEPQAKKEAPKTEPGKSILKSTTPVAPATEEQVRRERIKAEFLRGALGAAPKQTKDVMGALFDMGKEQSARLKPEMKNLAEPEGKGEAAEEAATASDKT
ncbi:hypothetical protein [Herbaspirillum sp. alder98]|uniref:hypothetical protein n=1 Tax=Herbaspirillum sp. alder98 TaxID=2913096 RepID=UPI001CD87548|nr:hypothetical protein [Herbaspirillum sp. alder98]MCA1322871.1 hypothetical protein [Herbaspirillum sp. alder98]